MQHFYSVDEAAKLLGVSVNSIKGYKLKGLMPEPDARIGRNHGWAEQTLLDWHATRSPRVTPVHPN